MNQLSENVLVLNVGDQLPMVSDAIKIYLAGTEDMNPANEHWQNKFAQGMTTLTEGPGAISVFKGKKWIFLNPMSAPQMNPEPNIDNPEWVAKKEWELSMMNAADGIFMNILKKSTSPLPLYTFGLMAQSGKMAVRCSPEYFQYGNIAFMCQKNNIPLLPSTANIKDAIWALFAIVPALQQNQQIQLPE